MKHKNFLKKLTAGILGFVMTLGVGAAGYAASASETKAAYVDSGPNLDLTTKSVSCNAYNTSTTYGDWIIVNGANNSNGWTYYKMGGKSATLSSNNPCYIYSTAGSTTQIDKVTVSIAAGSLSKSGMSVNSWGVYVYSNSALTTQIDYVSGGTITKNAGTFDFTPSSGKTWAKGSYFKVNWDLANTTTTNGIVCVDKINLYKDGSSPTPTSYTVSYNGNGNTGGSVPTDSTSYSSGGIVTVLGNTGNLVKTGYTFSGWNTASDGSGTTYAAGGTFNISANTTLYAKWVEESSGDSYKIVFANSANSNTQISATTRASTVISQGTDYVDEQPFSAITNAYYGDNKTSIRLGKSGTAGSLTISLSDSGSVTCSSFVVNCYLYNSSKAATLNVNSIGALSVSSTASDLTFTYDEPTEISSITFSSSQYIFINSITVNIGQAATKHTVTYAKGATDATGTPPTQA
ncbi:MAG: InlB B-repeat-containing protein, partial [Coriobacteriales bacterium]|nr:InlB B-repeat-containing protein [Coriobacteriales bacterium]